MIARCIAGLVVACVCLTLGGCDTRDSSSETSSRAMSEASSEASSETPNAMPDETASETVSETESKAPTSSQQYPLMRTLDFSPFEAALNALGDEQLAALDTLTLESSVSELRLQLAAGAISARELTLFYLYRIRAFDGSLCSVMELNPEALAEADRLDALQASTQKLGRLHGMPILLKDNIATGDRLHNSAGAAVLADHRASRDAFIVSQLRGEGALILGKANLSEWAFFMSPGTPSGYSALGGQTINPHGSELKVLGSSTGSAVAAAMRLAAATVGTETTGSIIAPAAANGVAGMRPTLGLVSSDLIIPISAAFDGAGPIARDVESLAQMLTVLGARDDNDPNVALARGLHGTDFMTTLDSLSLEGLRIGIPSVAGMGADEAARRILQPAIEALESAGATVKSVSISRESLQVLSKFQVTAFADGLATDLAHYLNSAKAPVQSLSQVIAFNEQAPARRVPFGQDYLIMARDSRSTTVELNTLLKRLRSTAYAAIVGGAGAHAKAEVTTNGDGDSTADSPIESTTNSIDVYLSLDNTFSLYYALAGVPAVTVPIGLDTQGQPHGATFVGIDRGVDAQLLSIAHAFEQATRLRVEPKSAP